MKNFLSNVLLVIVGVIISVFYWIKWFLCLPFDLVLWLLSKVYFKLYLSTPDGYFNVAPNSIEEVEEYYKRAEEQYSKCKCEKCQRTLEVAKMFKDSYTISNNFSSNESKGQIVEKADVIKCALCGSICIFNGDSRVYYCPICNK